MRRRPDPVIGRAALCALLAGALLAACDRPAFQLTVTFPGPLEFEAGSEVRYQGVRVGTVEGVSLGQSDPSEAGRVELQVVIDADRITLRRDDVFEIASDGLMGDDYLRIVAAAGSSPPLVSGDRVAGRPPLATRVVETAEQALERLGRLAREQADLLVDAIADQIEEEDLRPEPVTPAPPPDAKANDEAAP